MINIFEISLTNPVRFYPSTATPGKHMDDDGYIQLLKSFEKDKRYYQKWQKDDTIRVQFMAFSAPVMNLINCSGKIIKTYNAVEVVASPGLDYSIYEAYMGLSDVAEGIYYLTATATGMESSLSYISEPLDVKEEHPGTMLFTYKNTLNDFGLVFSGYLDVGYDQYTFQPTFRCEAGIMDFEPVRDRTAYTDQVNDVTTLFALPGRQFKLYIGDAYGVAPYIIDILNRIFCCDYVLIDDKQYESTEGSKWEIERVKGYPLIGGSLDLVPAQNRSSQQQSIEVIAASRIVAAYNIEAEAFGYGNAPAGSINVQVENIE